MPRKQTKLQRQQALNARLKTEPFLTDEELAKIFAVSIQTIRLDRMELNIPELRERTRQVAEQAYANVKALQAGEIVGELLELELGSSGVSVLETEAAMSFTRNRIIRGHYIFAQANSLAVALVDAQIALTASASVKFRNPAKVGDRLVAKATVISSNDERYQVDVITKTGDRLIFEGSFVVAAL